MPKQCSNSEFEQHLNYSKATFSQLSSLLSFTHSLTHSPLLIHSTASAALCSKLRPKLARFYFFSFPFFFCAFHLPTLHYTTLHYISKYPPYLTVTGKTVVSSSMTKRWQRVLVLRKQSSSGSSSS